MVNKYITAYVRLSQEDLDKEKDYSDSIYNQLALIKSYANSMGFEVNKEYIDDGYSGTNFDRPGFGELRNDIEKGLVSLVFTKDMSRLGRNFLETAYYISEYFPKYEVRYIAINDEYDSEKTDVDEQQIMVGLRSVINDRYVKETSIKRKQVAEAKTEAGHYIGFTAPYGYKVVKHEDKRTLEIDEYAGNIVKRIFTEIASGKSRVDVANGLNADKVIPPVIYMNMTPSRNKKYYYDWSDKIVYRILKNATYTGKIVKRKSTKRDYLQKKRTVIPIRDRETISNCHPPIITEELFNEANEKLRTLKRKEKNNYSGLFSGLVICGECGRKMTACRRNDRNKVVYYFECTKVENRKSCPNRSIVDSKLKKIVASCIKDKIETYVDKNRVIDTATNNMIKAERPNLKISHLKEDIELHNTNLRNLYLMKTKNEITLEEFLEKKKNEAFLKEQAEQKLKELIESKNIDTRKESIIEKYNHFINEDELMNNALRELVDNIIIYKDNTIKISFKFGLGEPKKIRLF